MSETEISSADLLKTAVDQEAQARQILIDGVTERARSSEDFRQLFKKEPEKAVRTVAESLPSEQRQSLDDKAISDTAEKLKAISEALPGIKEEDVSRLVFTTIDDTRKSFVLSLRLSQILFFAGLVMIALTFIALLFMNDERLGVLVFGGGSGFLGVISSLLINPIDRVQNAAGNLVQLEIAYLSYYKQLTMLNPIEGHNTPKDIVYISREVRKAMEESIELIEKYCEYQRGSNKESKAAKKSENAIGS